MVTPEFTKWACSYAGCDCGDIESPIWLCGIEWGFSKEYGDTHEQYSSKQNNYYAQALKNEIAKGGCEASKSNYFCDDHDEDPGGRLKYPYIRSAAKLLGALKGWDINDLEVVKSRALNDNIFHINLYPIAFPHESDELWLANSMPDVTGLATKQLYRTWCMLNRFPWIADQVEKHKPAVFIGTGIGYLADFIVCCGGKRIIDNVKREEITGDPNNPATTTRALYWARVNEKTILAVIPFFTGRYGLNSNELIRKFGEGSKKSPNSRQKKELSK
ncbi:hypothetical protein FP507_10085 [Chlorobium phaeovibrioides]|uniref:Uncharacterized protein n=1 Tax=Chlorobium phaeovibrioides TaxID=1094 RepID=A0A5M8I544_CHLPH|nr:hypothetical protein [Chlorobium phaeovibrioides]KAA6230598.1 hypothetical protein FP507_10085 [Chlorobium phaeovibrioides]